MDGLTKGVIYHHFKSKQDIFDTILNALSKKTHEKSWSKDREAENSFDKLQQFLIDQLKSYEQISLMFSAKVMLKSPKIIGEIYLDAFKHGIPIINKYIYDGIEDGSIVTEFPEELSELLVLTISLLIGIQMPKYTREQMKRKFLFLKKTTEGLNVPIINDEILEAVNELYNYLEKNENC